MQCLYLPYIFLFLFLGEVSFLPYFICHPKRRKQLKHQQESFLVLTYLNAYDPDDEEINVSPKHA